MLLAMGFHRHLFILVCCLKLAAAQQDFYSWLESSTNNKLVAPTEPRGPHSCVWEDAPENGYSFTTCPSGICSDQKGSYKRNGTIRFTWCKKNYALSQGSDRDTCIKASWTSSNHKCIPCGRSPVTSTPQDLTLTSEVSDPGSFPWTATIYTWSLNPSSQVESWQLACSGILMSPSSVLTAGHCVGDVTPKTVRVGLGKMRSGIDAKESNAIISDVKVIVRPVMFGKESVMDQDVVLLVLSQTVDSTVDIMPVCLDWTGSMKPRQNEIGFLAGWDSNDQSTSVKWGYKKYVDNDTCIKQLRSRDRGLVTLDKFCLEEAKGSTSSKGDGAGVTFVRDGAHYVYGVVSGKVEAQRKDFKLVTDLVSDKHRTWIQRNWRRLHRGTQLPPPRSQPGVGGECSQDSDCHDDEGCVDKTCTDLCLTACGVNSDCTMVNHQPVCKCKPGYKGNAHESCTKELQTLQITRNYTLASGNVCKQDGPNLWTCQLEGFCTTAYEDNRNGITSESCNSEEDGEPVICCEPDVLKPVFKEQSKTKCQTFAQSLYSEVPRLGGGLEMKDTCSIPKIQVEQREYATFKPGEFPHLGIIGNTRFNSWNYGSLISDRWFLTSAACTNKTICNTKVRLGIFDSSNGDGQGLPEYDVIEKHIHPEYKVDSAHNSIGLYKLKTVVRFSQFIRPACLVSEHQFPGTKGIILGEKDDILMKSTSVILPNPQCNLTNTVVHDPSMYCVDSYRGIDGLVMYAGFPMVVPLEEPYCMYGQVGISSFGASKRPEGFARVSYYLPWIESLVWPQ